MDFWNIFLTIFQVSFEKIRFLKIRKIASQIPIRPIVLTLTFWKKKRENRQWSREIPASW